MKDKHYWKTHYVVQSDPCEIERNIKLASFISGGKSLELICFKKDKNAPSVLISPGSGGHSYVFAELAFAIHLKGYNVFVMPKHGGHTITQLMARHADALQYISRAFNDRTGVFAEGLGGYACFYLALAGGAIKSAIFQNAPAILTEEKFHAAIFGGAEPAAERRRSMLPLVKPLSKLVPWLKLPISTYLDFQELIDTTEENRRIEAPIVQSFYTDPDFDRRYPLSAIMSLVDTPPPSSQVSELHIPVMFMVPVRGFFPSYFRDLYDRIPSITSKKFIEVDGSVFWMLSHPTEAAQLICEWFDQTL